jgi:CRP-like cAMP-binding protein
MTEVTAWTLARQRFLSGMRADQLHALGAKASEVTFPAGHRIFADGGYVSGFWLIEGGHVALEVAVPGERPAVVESVGIGGLLGWSWLVPPFQWSFGAVCVTEVTAIQFDAAAVRDLCLADPALGAELMLRVFRVLADRLQHTRAALVAKSAG